MKCSVLNLHLQTWKVNKKHSNEIDTKQRKHADAYISPDPKVIYWNKKLTKQREMQERKQGVVGEIAPEAQTPFTLNSEIPDMCLKSPRHSICNICFTNIYYRDS